MKRYDYIKAHSVDEAIGLLKEYGPRAMLIAGGTDVMVGVKQGKFSPEVLISLREIEGLNYIKADQGSLKIGALTTHRELERSAVIAERFRALKDAVENLGSVQIRNVATIGGNICNAAPSADTAPPLLVHDAEVEIKGPGGERRMPLEDFFLGPGKTALGPEEVLLGFSLPWPAEDSASAYWKHSRRQAMDLPILGVAMYLEVELRDPGPLKRAQAEGASMEEQLRALNESDILCREIRLALGVAAPTPIRTKRAEGILKGQRLTKEGLIELGRVASEEAQPRDTIRGAAWYRREMIRVLPKRLALRCLERIFRREEG